MRRRRVYVQCEVVVKHPAEVVTRLRNGESNIADHFDDATVIFADVVGFGKITARMKAYEIVACLNQLFSEFDKLAEDVGIEKIKTIGDNYMAVAGVPTSRSNHARMAAKFALDMVAATGRLRARLPTSFTIRVGLHSGAVMAGVIGTRKFAYDVWGDTVNIAARMEAASQPSRVLASAATVKALGSDYAIDGPHKIGTKEGRVLEAFSTFTPKRLQWCSNEQLDISHRAMTKGGGPSGAIVTDPPLGDTGAPAGGAIGTAASVAGGLPGSTTTRVPILTRL
jgi:class 3 adenylate cyclase